MKKKSGRKSRIITCPHCGKRFSLHSKKRTVAQKIRDRNRARMNRTSKKIAKKLAETLLN